jgi:hypothetical protein
LDIQLGRNFLPVGVETDIGIVITNLCTHTFNNIDIDVKLKVIDSEKIFDNNPWDWGTPLCIDGTEVAEYVEAHSNYPKKIHFDTLPPEIPMNQSFIMHTTVDGKLKLSLVFTCRLDAIDYKKEIPIMINSTLNADFGMAISEEERSR